MQKKILIDLGVALIVGVLTGLLTVVFNWLLSKGIGITRTWLEWHRVFYIILPLCAALFTYLLYTYGFKNDHSGFGVVQVLAEMQLTHTHLMKPMGVVWRVLASLVTLVGGMTAGRFGPIVHLGAAVGSNLAYIFHTDEERIRLMIGCGAAAAIASVFDLPFFGALFVLEVLFRDRNFVFLAPLLLSSIASKGVGDMLLGSRDFLIIPVEQLGLLWTDHLMGIILLGLVMGAFATLYLLSIEKMGEYFSRLPKLWVRLGLASLLVGAIAYFFPLQFEMHSRTTQLLFLQEVSIQFLFVLSFVRILTAGLTLGSGFIGGNFYPAVTIGAASGLLLHQLFLAMGVAVGSRVEYGVLGIVGLLAAYLHAPLACIVFAIELTNTVDLLLPAMVVALLSLSVAHILYGQDIFAKPLGKVMTDLKKMSQY